MRELPRQLTVDELSELFEGRTRLVERLAELETLSSRPTASSQRSTTQEKVEALDAHPAIGQRAACPRARPRSRATTAIRCVLSELAYLNQVYEEKFGFRFVVFVNGRPKAEILEVLRERIANTREEELDTGCRELVAIARDRWTRT